MLLAHDDLPEVRYAGATPPILKSTLEYGQGEAGRWQGVYLHDDTDQRGDDACSSVQQRSAAILTACTMQMARTARGVRPTI